MRNVSQSRAFSTRATVLVMADTDYAKFCEDVKTRLPGFELEAVRTVGVLSFSLIHVTQVFKHLGVKMARDISEILVPDTEAVVSADKQAVIRECYNTIFSPSI